MPLDFSAQAEAVGSGGNYNVKAPKADARMAKTISDISEGVQPLPTTWSGPSSKPLPSKTALPLSKEDIQREEAKGKLDFSSQAEGSAAMQGLEAIEPSVKREQPPEESFGKKALGVAEGVMGTGINMLGGMLGAVENMVKTPAFIAEAAMGTPEKDRMVKPSSLPMYEPHTESGKNTMDALGKVIEPLTAIMPDMAAMHGLSSTGTPKPKLEALEKAVEKGEDPYKALADLKKPEAPKADFKGQAEIPFSTSVEEIAARRAKNSPQRDMFADTAHEEAPVKAEEASFKEGAKKELPDNPDVPIIGEKTSDLAAAVNKIQAGKSFQMSAEEKIAWHKANGLDNVAKNSDHDWKPFQEKIQESKTAGDALQSIASDKDSLLHHRVLAKALLGTDAAKARLNFWLPKDVEGAKYHGQRGTYYPQAHSISMFEGAGTASFLHEATHAAVVNRFQALAPTHESVVALNRLFHSAVDEARDMGKNFYGIKNVHEFIAEAFSNPEFQKFLSGINDTRAPAAGAKTLWNTFVDMTKKILGIKGLPNSALESVIKHSTDVMKSEGDAKKPAALEFHSEDVKAEIKGLLEKYPDIEHFTAEVVKRYGEGAKAIAPKLYKDASNKNVNPITPKQLAQDWYVKDGIKEATSTALRQNYEAATKDGLTKEMAEKFRDYGDGLTKLDAHEQAVYDKYVKPLIERTNAALEEAKKFADKNIDIDEHFNPRVALGHFSVWDRILGGSDQAAFQSPLGKAASILKSRKVFSLEGPDGTRQVISVDGGNVVAWNKGMPTSLGKYGKVSDVTPGKNFKGFNIIEATEKDIMADTNIKYLRDDVAVRTIKYMELSKYLEDQKFLDNLTKSPEFSKVAIKSESMHDVPAGWRRLANPDAIPSLRDYSFDPKIAEVLDDFSKKPGAHPMVDKFNNLAVSSIMLDPIPHMNNEIWHYITSRGLVGEWLNPMGLARVAKTIMPSIDSVLRQDNFQKELMQHGASMMYPRVANQGWLHNMIMDTAKQSLQRDSSFQGIAKATGVGIGELYNKISKTSSAAMWSARDMMYTSLIKDKMAKGMSMKEAVAETEKHMPSYRIPPRVLEKVLGATASRSLSKTMQNPVVSVFSRYHYGVLSHIGNAVGELGTSGKALKGADQLATMAVGYALLYPLMDKILQGTAEMMGMETDDAEELQWRRAGGAHLAELVRKGLDDEIGFATLVTAILTPSPALSTGMNLWTNRDAFTGKENIDLHDPATILDTAMNTAGKAFAPARTPQAIAADKMDGSQWAWSLSDVEKKTDKKEFAIEKAKRYKEKARKKAAKKRPEWEREMFE